MTIRSGPKGNHDWIPTPSIGKGPHNQINNFNYQCKGCWHVASKRELVNEEVPGECVNTYRKGVA